MGWKSWSWRAFYNQTDYFNNHFVGKVYLTKETPIACSKPSYPCIQDIIMKDKKCTFKFCKVTIAEVQKLILSIQTEKLPGTHIFNGKLQKLAAEHIATPTCHIFNLSLQNNMLSQSWKDGYGKSPTQERSSCLYYLHLSDQLVTCYKQTFGKKIKRIQCHT